MRIPLRSVASALVILLLAAGVQSVPADEMPPSRFEEAQQRLKPRAQRTASQRADWIAELRELYTRDPQTWPAPHVDPAVHWQEIGLLQPVQHPEDNPHSQEKEELGKILFFDPRLSGSGQIACASCHDPDLHWADGRTTSFGHSRALLARNAPTVRNSGYFSSLFWDGRADSLEDQAIAVFENPHEMRADEVSAIELILSSDEYRQRFEASFGDSKITFERIAQAIACFERTIVGGRSRFDAFLNGRLPQLSDTELVGLDLFRRQARCLNCHNSPLFSDGQFHNVGLSYYRRQRFEDLGRYEVTKDPADVGSFRTPSLRDVTRTTPLMHNGLFELTGVLNMYNAGMPTLRRKAEQQNDPLFPTKSSLLQPLGLNKQDLADLHAFLESLEEPKMRMWAPPLPELDVDPHASQE